MSIENAIQSLHFGRHFWLDEDKELCSCPTFIDGTPDEDNWDYVSEWTDLEGLNLDKLLYVHRQLIIQDADWEGGYTEVRKDDVLMGYGQ